VSSKDLSYCCAQTCHQDLSLRLVSITALNALCSVAVLVVTAGRADHIKQALVSVRVVPACLCGIPVELGAQTAADVAVVSGPPGLVGCFWVVKVRKVLGCLVGVLGVGVKDGPVV